MCIRDSDKGERFAPDARREFIHSTKYRETFPAGRGFFCVGNRPLVAGVDQNFLQMVVELREDGPCSNLAGVRVESERLVLIG